MHSLTPRMQEDSSLEQPLLDAILRHEHVDDIIGALIDSLRVLLYRGHHWNQKPSSSSYQNVREATNPANHSIFTSGWRRWKVCVA